MREVAASDVDSHLPSLLDDVERGETLVITRGGKPIARLVPEPECRRAEIENTLAAVQKFRNTAPSLPLEDLLRARREGHGC